MNPFKQAILATIAYYDALQMPLTAFETWKYLLRRPAEVGERIALTEVLHALQELNGTHLESKNGMYMLAGRTHLYEMRIERQKIADRKWKRVRRVAWWLQMVPFVRLVFASGSLVYNNTRDSSDLDLLIVAAHGRIWTGRALVTAVTELFGVRRRRFGVIAKDKICLNHYLSTQGLCVPYPSIYNAQTYARLIPLVSAGITPEDFWSANKTWIDGYLAQLPAEDTNMHIKAVRRSKGLAAIRTIGEWLLAGRMGGRIERLFARIQSNRIRRDPWTYRTGGRVVYSDVQLEFHPDSPERAIVQAYNTSLVHLGLAHLAHEQDSGLL